MARVLFTITYTVSENQKKYYQELITQVKGKFASNPDVQYSVFEVRGKRNTYQEVFIYPSKEVFDASDEIAEKVHATELVEQIHALTENVQYTTAFEV
ncbi:MAG: hypothetical protein V4642_00305 [Bacteroidota bacterium]|jgi:hypothetical protein